MKSLGGEDVGALVVDGRGAAGDRTHAILDTHQGATRRLTARQAPRMLLWQARYPDVADDAMASTIRRYLSSRVPADGAQYRWDDPGLPSRSPTISGVRSPCAATSAASRISATPC